MRVSGVQQNWKEAQESHFWQRHSTRCGSSAGGRQLSSQVCSSLWARLVASNPLG